MKVLNCKKYMQLPIELTPEEANIFSILYKNCDIDTMIVEYTLENLTNDSYKVFNLTKGKVNTIIKKLINKGFITKFKKGTKGYPTKYKVNLYIE